MNKNILALVAVAVAASAQAQTLVNRADGANTLLAGWDFNQGSGSSYASINARYSDQFSPAETNGTLASPGDSDYGVAYFTTNGGTFTSNVARPTSGFDSTDRQIATRTGGVDFLGELTGGEGALNPNTTAAVTRDIVFLVHALNAFDSFENINLTFTAHSNSASQTVTIDWFYATSAGGAKVDTGIETLISGTAYGSYSADFSSVVGMDGVQNLYIVARITESSDAASLFLDNTAVYGTSGPLSAIPEPSSFAALAGLAGLGLAASRRRRA